MNSRKTVFLLLSCFGYLFSLSQNPAPVWNKEKKYGAINGNGELVIPFEYDYIQQFFDGLAVVEKNNQYGLIDKTGKLVLPVIYQSISHCANSGWPKAVQVNGKWGAVNQQQQLVIPALHPYLSCFEQGLARVEDAGGSTYGLIDSTGHMLIPFGKYDWIEPAFSEGLTIAKYQELYGYINRAGEEVIPYIYMDADPFKNGIARVKKGAFEEFINKKGEKVKRPGPDFSLTYDEVYPPSEGLRKVHSEKKGWCYIDSAGKVIIKAGQYSAVEKFSEGIAFVKKGEKWGGIDKKGNPVIPFLYNAVFRFFESGIALLQNENGDLVALNKTGVVIYTH